MVVGHAAPSHSERLCADGETAGLHPSRATPDLIVVLVVVLVLPTPLFLVPAAVPKGKGRKREKTGAPADEPTGEDHPPPGRARGFR